MKGLRVRETLKMVTEKNSHLENVMEILRHELDEMHTTKARVCGMTTAQLEMRHEVPKPKEFHDKKDAKEIVNFF